MVCSGSILFTVNKLNKYIQDIYYPRIACCCHRTNGVHPYSMLLLHAGVARKGVPSACVLVLDQEIHIQVPFLAHKINNLSTNMLKSVVPYLHISIYIYICLISRKKYSSSLASWDKLQPHIDQ